MLNNDINFDFRQPNSPPNKEVVFFTSFNKRIFEFNNHLVLEEFYKRLSQYKLTVYHENSFELAEYGTCIKEEEFKKYPNIIIKDLFEEAPWLDSFLKTSPFSECHKLNPRDGDVGYYNRSSPFWFRKVVALYLALEDLKPYQVGIWIDADCYIKKQFPPIFFDYVNGTGEYRNNYDWLVIFRKDDWIESGFQIISGTERSKEFARLYLDYYRSGKVFKDEIYWADGWVLGSCMGREPLMRIGGLTPEFNCPINIYDYIYHSKGTIKKIRCTENL